MSPGGLHRAVNWFRRLTQRYAWLRRAPRLLRKGRGPIIIAWALLVVGITQTDRFAGYLPVQKADQARTDWRFQTRGQVPGHPGVVIVGVNDSTMDQGLLSDRAHESAAIELMVKEPYPWDRRVWVELIERLMAAGAKVVAMDFIFHADRPGDAELAPVIAKYRDRLVLGSMFSDKTEHGADNQLIYRRPATALIGEGDPSDIVGSCRMDSEVDKAIRRFNMRTSLEREFGMDEGPDDIVSFAPLAVAKFLGKPAPFGHRQPINYQGRETMYKHYPIEEVLADSIYLRDPKYAGGQLFKDKLVFVGPVAEIMHDIHLTPFGEMPGVEIHANIAGSLLANRPLKDAPPATGRWLALGVGLLTALSVLRIRAISRQFVAVVALMTVTTVVTQWLFSSRNILVPVSGADFSMVLVGGFGILFNAFIDQFEKGLIRGVLDRYVSKNVASLVVEQADNFAEMLRGEKRCVSVLFSDIRGFTGIFESSDATALVDQLNEYFREMVACIHQQGGTLQKFIGDAIVAAWGDVESRGHEEDAVRAVRAALAMRPALAALNKRWAGNPERVQMRIGIGLNFGEVVVGEIGSPERKEFTVIGDAVNTASRFEGATKYYAVDILIGGSVEQLAQGRFVFRRVDLTRLKGKKNAIETFTVLSDASVPAPEWLARWHEAIEHFRAQRWPEAEALLVQVSQETGGDVLCRMYLARLADFSLNPPPVDWDGAHTMTEK